MSIRLMTQILDEDTNLTGMQRFLLVVMADFADEDGTCWPKIKTLAKRLNIDTRQTQRHLKALRDQGYVEVIESGKGKRSNTYKVGVSHVTCHNRRVTNDVSKTTPVINDTTRGVISDTPPNLYNEPSMEPPKKKGCKQPKEKAAPSSPKVSNSSIEVPSELDTPEFHQAWEEWQAFQKEIKKPITPTSSKKQLKQLADYGVKGAIESIEQSIAKGWKGLFDPPAKKFPFNLRHFFKPKSEIPEANWEILSGWYDTDFYCDDKTGKVYDANGKHLTNYRIDPADQAPEKCDY